MSDSPSPAASASRFPLAVLIAFVPGASYLCAFLYQLGYAQHFGIPAQLIHVTLESVFLAGGVIGSTGYYAFTTVGSPGKGSAPMSPALRKRFLEGSVLVVLLGLATFISGHWKFHLVVFAVFMFFLFGLSAVPHAGKGISYAQALEEWDKNHGTYIDFFITKLGVNAVANVLIVVMILFQFWLYGDSEAVQQRNFLVRATRPETVLLRVYGDKMIFATLRPDRRSIDCTFQIREVADKSNLTLRLQHLGYLKVFKPKEDD
jgi:hypothetical protein